MSRKLQVLFQRAQQDGRALFLPYVCLGYPDYRSSLETAKAALRAGAAALELGVPFSDPIADGPTLQKATFRSLAQGTKFRDVFRLIRDLRKAGFDQPLLVMTYLNLVDRMGLKAFAEALVRAGGDGAIIPDLPLEEFPAWKKIFDPQDLALIPFVAPTSPASRVRLADSMEAPFLYYVSVTGVTGVRKTLAPGLLRDLQSLDKRLRTPVVVGFGISNARQAAQVGKVARGVIIASALIQLISRTPKSRIAAQVGRFCAGVVSALRRG
ncbi:MAG TPA: tryptophan synthase subunit alpha [bacterium]|nr:tryptophan synthase subunit alpha [bacterium]